MGWLEKIGVTFIFSYLYGYVKSNIFHVGEFKFDFSIYNDYDQYEGKHLKFKADQINVEFLKKNYLAKIIARWDQLGKIFIRFAIWCLG